MKDGHIDGILLICVWFYHVSKTLLHFCYFTSLWTSPDYFISFVCDVVTVLFLFVIFILRCPRFYNTIDLHIYSRTHMNKHKCAHVHDWRTQGGVATRREPNTGAALIKETYSFFKSFWTLRVRSWKNTVTQLHKMTPSLLIILYSDYLTSETYFRQVDQIRPNELKGGPEPSILDDFCLGNVISKYFSKLRFGTT